MGLCRMLSRFFLESLDLSSTNKNRYFYDDYGGWMRRTRIQFQLQSLFTIGLTRGGKKC